MTQGTGKDDGTISGTPLESGFSQWTQYRTITPIEQKGQQMATRNQDK